MDGDTPFVTVIMPVYNEEGFIAHSLGAILAQDYPPDHLEIIVADGASDDATLDIIRSLPGASHVRTLNNSDRTQAAGMNLAIDQAHGDIIVRVDGHTVIAPDYVRQCVAALRETDAQNVGGCLDPVGVTPMGKAIAAACKSVFAVPSAFHVASTGRFTDTAYMGAWPRSVFQQVGGFDERLSPNEDYELNYRIRKAGGRIYLTPTIHSDYFGRQTVRALAIQYFHYGRAKTRTGRKDPRSLRPRHLVAPAFVGVLFGALPFVLVGVLLSVLPALADGLDPRWQLDLDSVFVTSPQLPSLGALITGLWLSALLAYVVVNLAFSLRVARRAGYALLWRIPLVFATVHVAWGTGFWVGLLSGGAHTPRPVAREHRETLASLQQYALVPAQDETLAALHRHRAEQSRSTWASPD